MNFNTFDAGRFTTEHLEIKGSAFYYRAYRNIPYVPKPLSPRLQVMNIFIPQAYIDGQTLGSYSLGNAPIFFPNGVGGYMEALPCVPRLLEDGSPNTEAAALAHGYIVVSAGARGRTTADENGVYTGKAPAVIVDLKAAIRFFKHIAPSLGIGNPDTIISNGTSAGGALSALLAASGDNSEYDSYLEEIGAYPESDRIFAASCYCPITNLENADSAYEWQYGHLDSISFRWDAATGTSYPEPVRRPLSEQQRRYSAALKRRFPDYINTLHLKNGGLRLDTDGSGSFREYIGGLLLRSAEEARRQGIEIPPESGINPASGSADLERYCEYITRMKAPGAFDNPSMRTPENQLFGSPVQNTRHFTSFAMAHHEPAGAPDAALCSETLVRLMNPMYFLGSPGCARHWRIRHGAADRDTSFAVSAILALTLEDLGYQPDYKLPWGVPHSGDYDLEELFAWIDALV